MSRATICHTRWFRPVFVTIWASLLLAGCWDDGVPTPEPEWKLTNLRILGIQADPPEAAPGMRVRFSSLVVDPPALPVGYTLAWIVCEPRTDSAGGAVNPCTDQATSRDLAVLAQDPPEGVQFIPVTEGWTYTVPKNVFDSLPKGSPQRVRGLTLTVLLVAFKGNDPALLADPEIRKQVAIKRVNIRDRHPDMNKNPRIASLLGDDQEIPEVGLTARPEGSSIALSLTAAEGSAQSFDRTQPDGTLASIDEKLLVSWYVTGGELIDVESLGNRRPTNVPVAWRLPAIGDTEDGSADVYAVLRDVRGGMGWVRRRITLAPAEGR